MEVLGAEHPDIIRALKQLALIRRDAECRLAASNREDGNDDTDGGDSDIESDGDRVESLDENERRDDASDPLQSLHLNPDNPLSDLSEGSDEEGGISLLTSD